MLHVQLLANKITARIQILDGTNFLLSTQHGPVAIVNFHSQLRPFSRFHGFNFMVLLFICQWNILILTEEGPLLAGGKLLPLPRVESDRQLVAAAAGRSSAPAAEAQWRAVSPLPRPRALVIAAAHPVAPRHRQQGHQEAAGPLVGDGGQVSPDSGLLLAPLSRLRPGQ